MKIMAKEDIELAEEHIKLAEDLIQEEAKKEPTKNKKFLKVAFELEKAEADLEEE